jgi:hypothetical protein
LCGYNIPSLCKSKRSCLECDSRITYTLGEVIVSPEQGAVDRFLVIKQGMVHGEQNVANATEADTLATAQLFQIAQAQACTKNITNFAGLFDLENAQRRVSGVS